MEIKHPDTEQLVTDRNAMLQKALREEPLPFSIQEEYPLVLSADGKKYSYCLTENNTIIAHLNLLPRTVVDRNRKKTFEIGLIGNVATSPEYRGKGIMRNFFTQLNPLVSDLEALVLWSDLIQFYQNLGFMSQGKEYRFTYKKGQLPEEKGTRQFLPTKALDLTDRDLKNMLDLRPKLRFQIERPVQEFRKLLSIPVTGLFTKRVKGKITGYGIWGRGYDMMGIVHEWGVKSASDIRQLLMDIVFTLDLPEIILLVPSLINESWRHILSSWSAPIVEEHPMAMMKFTEKCQFSESEKKEIMDGLFIWGLDSI